MCVSRFNTWMPKDTVSGTLLTMPEVEAARVRRDMARAQRLAPAKITGILAIDYAYRVIHAQHGRAIDLWADSKGDAYVTDPAWFAVKEACAEAWDRAAEAFDAYSDHTAHLCRVAAWRWRKLTEHPGPSDFYTERSAVLSFLASNESAIREARAKLTS